MPSGQLSGLASPSSESGAGDENIRQVLGLEEWQGETVVGTLDGPEGAASAEALAMVREHLSSVREELDFMQRRWDEHMDEQRRLEEGMDVSDGDVSSLHRKLRHTQMDRDAAVEKAEKLAAERQEGQAAQARLEASLRETRKKLDEARRQAKHKDLQLSELSGRPLLEDDASAPTPPDSARGDSADDELVAASISAAAPAKAVKPATKEQALHSLKATQVQLKQERKRREGVEMQAAKDQERLQRLVAVAEKQRTENEALRKHCAMLQANGRERDARLHASLGHISALHADLHGAVSMSPGSSGGGGRRAAGGKVGLGPMSRTSSAPTLAQAPSHRS